MTKRTVITVDGLAGTGKTSISQALAQRLDFVHFSTGLIYRAVGYLCQKYQVDPADEERILTLIDENEISLIKDEQGSSVVTIKGEPLGDELQEPEISELTSKSASLAGVRQRLVEVQRRAFQGMPLVAEGRDMGTVIFPEADLKFFLEVDPQVKLERRMRQLGESRGEMSDQQSKLLKDQMKIEIEERDHRDANRKVSPTEPAADAHLVDNSAQQLTKIVEKMYNMALEQGLVARG